MSVNEYVLGFVMTGGNGSRLRILTKDRCKPDLNILGHYKLFDFVASNIINTGILVIGKQYTGLKSISLP
jgi:glucose-1-phosphate adenylyltransferase